MVANGPAAAPAAVHGGLGAARVQPVCRTGTACVPAVHHRTTPQIVHLSGKEKSFVLTLISLYAYIHNFKVVFFQKALD